MKLENYQRAGIIFSNIQYYQNKIDSINKVLSSDKPIQADISSEGGGTYESQTSSMLHDVLEFDKKVHIEELSKLKKQFEELE